VKGPELKVNDRAITGNAFEFVTVAGARARQLLRGCTPKTDGSNKPAKLAQKEVREGKIQRVEKSE
jgi:DNA-directed RNA polymerase subunit K/omega